MQLMEDPVSLRHRKWVEPSSHCMHLFRSLLARTLSLYVYKITRFPLGVMKFFSCTSCNAHTQTTHAGAHTRMSPVPHTPRRFACDRRGSRMRGPRLSSISSGSRPAHVPCCGWPRTRPLSATISCERQSKNSRRRSGVWLAFKLLYASPLLPSCTAAYGIAKWGIGKNLLPGVTRP